MTDDEKRALIVRIDPTERKIGLAAAVIAAVAALAYYGVFIIDKIPLATTVKPKGKTCPAPMKYAVSAGKAVCKTVYPASHFVFPMVVVLVLALAIYVTVRIRRRAPLAFAIIMTGLGFGILYIFVPFAVAGGWIMLRAWRAQKNGAPTARSPLPGWVPPAPRGTTKRATSSGPGRAKRSRSKVEEPKVRKPPTQNKRYTPKAPPKKKVTPPAS